MRFLLAFALLLGSGSVFAATQCTTADKSTWQDPDKFQAQLKEQGYKINKFKVTKGNCYEIYGFDKDGRKVEIYHDPVSGKAVKTEIED
ncbi:PepSY domain-containing protein [Pseudomonas sp. GD03858]|uniref:PepSY domain-containing protein n=1 Tax=unclassified Pseudomonas TaxID=196821 RepID=UPI00244A9DDB|nr:MULTISPECIES: PepSY domain-containing protein [unclassified Pseudomonas]MDH0304744.1 PepSY domain-containing protein [Pseudomonas sp. GD04091]MDH0646586.1 PepSY domain-containing protein [Pseudomonas sp. GD03867]MDH0662302.1 PepSY domain-containing protein [Pseudomonas sp. GD03858]MDH1988172.1 PepSY domain-containing protein [Pseudomonas sp. GD03689]